MLLVTQLADCSMKTLFPATSFASSYARAGPSLSSMIIPCGISGEGGTHSRMKALWLYTSSEVPPTGSWKTTLPSVPLALAQANTGVSIADEFVGRPVGFLSRGVAMGDRRAF